MDSPKAPVIEQTALDDLERLLSGEALSAIDQAVEAWVRAKSNGGKVLVATGSGPNLHEGATCQVAELVRLGLVDGVLTSSAVVGHEMAGSLERVRRVDGRMLGLPSSVLPHNGKVEVSLAGAATLQEMARRVQVDMDLLRRLLSAPGNEIIKVAGNLAYPTGMWVESEARRLLGMAKGAGLPLEAVAGLGCDQMTMIGACARRGVPCLVTVPQLVGGGQVGLAVGDSVPISRRSALVAQALAEADIIIESGLALAQEIHDGPFELFTGHGLWARYEGMKTFSLEKKRVVRMDLDPALGRAWELERGSGAVAGAIDKGLPKAAGFDLPFRMEMSGFARLPGSLPIIGDLGMIWPLLATKVAAKLGAKLDFVCYKQGMPPGESVREFIVENVRPLDPSSVVQGLKGV